MKKEFEYMKALDKEYQEKKKISEFKEYQRLKKKFEKKLA